MEGEFAAWVDKTPGAGLALTTVNWGMMIAGGPTRAIAGLACAKAQEGLEAAATGVYEAAEYGELTSRAGGKGLVAYSGGLRGK